MQARAHLLILISGVRRMRGDDRPLGYFVSFDFMIPVSAFCPAV